MKYRKNIRLAGYDYSTPNHYFVTICTHRRRVLFEPRIMKEYKNENRSRHVVVPVINRQNADKAECILLELEKYYSNLEIDFYVFMPDHVHMIIAFHDYVLLKSKPHSMRHYTLGEIVKSYKQVCSKKLRSAGVMGNVFQPNFYEHIIRSDSSLNRIRTYILNNPLVDHTTIPWASIDP